MKVPTPPWSRLTNFHVFFSLPKGKKKRLFIKFVSNQFFCFKTIKKAPARPGRGFALISLFSTVASSQR
uniref:hypothetical protein n=1 Tax=Candidatus Electrothrix sp. TaxID=2170559 RepID=UPI004055F72C